MNTRLREAVLACLAVTLLGASGTASAAQSGARKTYRWVDDQGVVHFGDQIPPEYADQDREIVNDQGVTVERVTVNSPQIDQTAEERAAAQRAAEEMARRDAILLSTYVSVDEITTLRDRRADLMDGQIRVTENYLAMLRQKLAGLETEAAPFRPYNADPAAPPIEEGLANEIAGTMESIALYEKTLFDSRTRQTELIAKFDADIARFKQLKGLD